MCKVAEIKSKAVVQVFRVECNHGNKYFADKYKASAYFDYMTTCGYEAEYWEVQYHYDESGMLVKAEQFLIKADTDDELFGSFN